MFLDNYFDVKSIISIKPLAFLTMDPILITIIPIYFLCYFFSTKNPQKLYYRDPNDQAVRSSDKIEISVRDSEVAVAFFFLGFICFLITAAVNIFGFMGFDILIGAICPLTPGGCSKLNILLLMCYFICIIISAARLRFVISHLSIEVKNRYNDHHDAHKSLILLRLCVNITYLLLCIFIILYLYKFSNGMENGAHYIAVYYPTILVSLCHSVITLLSREIIILINTLHPPRADRVKPDTA